LSAFYRDLTPECNSAGVYSHDEQTRSNLCQRSVVKFNTKKERNIVNM
jgi:hypothetical protein